MNRSMQVPRAFFKDVAAEWAGKAPARQAAALAYYSMFSLAPVIFVAFAISELLFKSLDFRFILFNQIEVTFGEEAADFIQSLVSGLGSTENGFASAGSSPLITLISLGALLYAATGLFYHLQYSLDLIWGVPWETKGGFLLVVRSRLIAFFLVICLGLFLVFLEVITFTLSLVRSVFQVEWLVPVVNALILFAIQVLVLMLIYKLLPRAKVGWRDVLLASILTAILINIARWGVSLYLSLSNVGSAFQAAGSLAVILIAVYYAAQIFLFGALFSRVYAHHFGSRKGRPLKEAFPAGVEDTV
ncbi:MAG TPA: YihY/virulence factor BrkB family protein [Anaerolineales bacterium]|nr:YihY/virulence factor BrkB family protein [Anaerolineales bacterium]